jgi:hypothetical protein
VPALVRLKLLFLRPALQESDNVQDLRAADRRYVIVCNDHQRFNQFVYVYHSAVAASVITFTRIAADAANVVDDPLLLISTP